MTDVSNFMDVRLGDVPEPQVLPNGEYIFTIVAYKTGEYPNDKATPYVRISMKPVEIVSSDISDEEFGRAKKVDSDFPMTEPAQPIARRFLTETLGLSEDLSFREAFEEALGLQVRAATKIKMVGKEKNIPIAEVERFFPID